MKLVKKSAVVATAFSLVILVLFSGCTTNPVIAKTSTPEPTQTATPTITPSPTPEPTPEPTLKPTHQPDLSIEEERALLGVKNENDVVDFNTCLIMYYTQKDENGNDVMKIAWVFIGHDMNDDEGIYDNWSEKKLYSIPKDASNEAWEYPEIVTPANKRLSDSKIIAITSLLDLEDFYKRIGIDFKLPESILSILALPGDEKEAYSLPMTLFMDLYIACTPKEYRTSWKDFDETLMPGTPLPIATISPN